MRIDSPKGIKSWLIGFFSGSFRGNLDGTASYAVTASYVESASYAEVANDLTEEAYTNLVDSASLVFVRKEGEESISGSLTIFGNSPCKLTVLGKTKLAGDVDVAGTMSVDSTVNIGSASLHYRDNFLEVKF